MIKFINNKIAVITVSIVSTMWCAYFFILLSISPTIFPKEVTLILFISNCFQLVLLPVIMVASNLEGEKTRQQQELSHAAAMQEFAEIKEILDDVTYIKNKLG